MKEAQKVETVMERVMSELTCDFVLVADRAEVINGKLYLMGGAWDRLAVMDFAQPLQLSVAVGVLVPWHATNRQHHVRVRLEDADGMEFPECGFEANFVAGRPPHLFEGDEQRIMFALPSMPVRFAVPGKYAVVAVLNGAPARRTTFSVVPAQWGQSARPNPAGPASPG